MRHERPAKREEEGGVKGGQGQEDEYGAWDGGGGRKWTWLLGLPSFHTYLPVRPL